MKKKIFTAKDLRDMSPILLTCFEYGCWRLLGMIWKKYIKGYYDSRTNSYIFEYE